MSQKILWLECKASEGQFQDEFAVHGKDFQGEEFSFFARRDLVNCKGEISQTNEVDALLEVTIIDQDNDLALVLLPGHTFGNGSTITVSMDDLKERKECESAY